MSKQYYSKQFSSEKVHFSSILPIYRTLSGATTQSQSGPGSDGNEAVLCILQSSSITGTSPSRLFSVITRTLISGGGSYLSPEKQSLYSTAPTNRVSIINCYLIL